MLDVAARAATAINRRGETYGRLQDGGTIVLGGAVDLAKGLDVYKRQVPARER